VKRLKPWERSLLFWIMIMVSLSLLGGYGTAYRILILKNKARGVGAQQFKQEQEIQNYQDEQAWLQRLVKRPPILESMKEHSFINPPSREMMIKKIKTLAEGFDLLKLAFEPEKQFLNHNKYAFCEQKVSAHVRAHDDRQVIAWLKELEFQIPGIFCLESINMKRGNDGEVLGEFVWQWSFLRLSF